LRKAAAPTPWVLTPDMGYGYDKEGKTFFLQDGHQQCGAAAEGREESTQGTLFFIGQNGQLYMRTARTLKATASSCSDRIEAQRRVKL